jgi:hypothetical protein
VTPTVRFPLDQVIHLDPMATVDTTVWCCRICERDGTAKTTPQAISDALTHLGTDHGGMPDRAPNDRGWRKGLPPPR